ncbi:N-acetyl-gamma-glutamyl-phosphate reductase [Anaerobacillus alkalilacustris]|uniref:N-acetyl-gamma-glutamyl-phosphate reductase n=1 Tax=Anaerobacillus alkalilacustris TaxID=393763 RepID=A0A1S2LDP1_9BACI|nr:N-acetyl-gamma-glutamyl-phosphate reductase [Anaerobacillus alkalilacustris]OIJ10476.1 N-acetyl-gamma-glutamyl-phosphate reductase [Anaerobacillus alkalilacustris]
MKAAIIGATGYGGAELVRILHQHDYIKQYSVYTSSQVGMKFSESYPQFNQITNEQLKEIDIDKISEEVDVVFMATPSGISNELTPKIFERGLTVIDLSGDLRFKDQDVYETWYKKKASPKDVLQKAVYGLTEINREIVKDAKLIANPGCYPTATILGLYPLLKNVKVDLDSIIIDAKSGVSGAGRKASLATSYCEVNENFRIYKVNEHQHIPEIEQALKTVNPELGPIKFNTHLVPMTRGIMATIYCKPLNKMTEKSLRDLYQDFYQNDTFVRVREEGNYPSTKEVYGSNYCDIGITYDERTGWVTIVSVIDNLMKGAAGQAVQNLNVMLGIDEGTGLYGPPLFP